MADDAQHDALIKEIAEAFLQFVHENPEVPLMLHVRIGEFQLELRYRAGEVFPAKGAVRFGFRSNQELVTV